MKKLLTGILILSGTFAFADVAVTPGSGKTVATDTNNSREYQAIEIVGPGQVSTAPVSTIGLKVDLSTTSVTNAAGTQLTVVSTGIPVTGTFFQATQPVSVATPYTVILTTAGVSASTVTAVLSQGSFNADTGLNVHLVNGGSGGTSSSIPGTFPATVTPIAGINPSGNLATFAVDSSSGLKISGQFTIPVTSSYTTVVSTGLPIFSNGVGVNVISTQTIAVKGLDSNNGQSISANMVSVVPGYAQTAYGNNGSVFVTQRGALLSVGLTDGNLRVTESGDMTVASYSASTNTASYASTTDLACLSGNASNTVQLYKMRVSCTQTTAGQVTLSILKRSSADTSTSVSSMTSVGMDSAYAVGKSTFASYGAAPTRGTLVGQLDVATIGCMASATASPNDIYVSPDVWINKPIILRGTAQQVCISLATPIDQTGTTVTGGTFQLMAEWKEVTTP